jgi:hypothetical protein
MPFSEALLRVIIKKIRNLPLLEPSMFFLWKRVVGISKERRKRMKMGQKRHFWSQASQKKAAQLSYGKISLKRTTNSASRRRPKNTK